MKTNNVLIVGGPKHGSKFALEHGSHFNYMKGPDWADADKYSDYHVLGSVAGWTPKVVSCPVQVAHLGQHLRSYALAPGISRETADAYFWDVVVDAYDRASRVL